MKEKFMKIRGRIVLLPVFLLVMGLFMPLAASAQTDGTYYPNVEVLAMDTDGGEIDSDLTVTMYRGDINQDGKIDVIDLQMYGQSERQSLTEMQRVIADINGDGRMNRPDEEIVEGIVWGVNQTAQIYQVTSVVTSDYQLAGIQYKDSQYSFSTDEKNKLNTTGEISIIVGRFALAVSKTGEGVYKVKGISSGTKGNSQSLNFIYANTFDSTSHNRSNLIVTSDGYGTTELIMSNEKDEPVSHYMASDIPVAGYLVSQILFNDMELTIPKMKGEQESTLIKEYSIDVKWESDGRMLVSGIDGGKADAKQSLTFSHMQDQSSLEGSDFDYKISEGVLSAGRVLELAEVSATDGYGKDLTAADVQVDNDELERLNEEISKGQTGEYALTFSTPYDQSKEIIVTLSKGDEKIKTREEPDKSEPGKTRIKTPTKTSPVNKTVGTRETVKTGDQADVTIMLLLLAASFLTGGIIIRYQKKRKFNQK